jgi:hypothetical protein
MLETSRILLTVLVVVGLPLTSLVSLLLTIGRMERARDTRVARQVALTDAIHRELGPVVAPVIERRIGRGWRVVIAVPFERPAIVERVVAIAHAALARDGAPAIEIALTAQPSYPRPLGTPGPFRAAVASLTAGGR